MNNMKNVITTTFFLLSWALLTSCDKTVAEIKNWPEPPFSQFILQKSTQLTPEGWLKQFLQYQKSGLTGNIEAAGYPFNGGMWMGQYAVNEEERFWWPYEQTGYYIDGAIKTGYLLKDEFLINKAKEQISYVLENQSPEGKLGPEKLIGRWNRWPYTGFLRSFMTEYQVNKDPQLLEAMQRHYALYEAADFADELDLCNAEALCWLYGLTGDTTLLNKAEKAYQIFKSDHKYRNRDGRDIVFASDRVPDYHGVCYIELVKIPAILYSYTGKQEYLDEALHGIEKMEKHHMLISGVPSSYEHFRGIHERAGHETCNIATLPYTYGYMLQITGEARWADKIEKAVFNAGIGSVTKDFKAHQYFSCPNQFVADRNACHLGYHPARMAFAPGHDTECCTGNVNRFMPYYAGQMWLKTKDNGVVASLFGASEFNTEVGEENTPVTLRQITRYPFEEEITFEVETKQDVAFTFLVRIPGWSENPQVTINGEPLEQKVTPGTFLEIKREFSNQDQITLSIPMTLRISHWPNNGKAVERGPIVFSYPIETDINIVEDYKKSTPEFPALAMMPKSDWNYALAASSASDIEIIENDNYEYAWDTDTPPIKVKVPVKKLRDWHLTHASGVAYDSTVYDGYQTPAFPEKRITYGPTEYIELIPYGNTLLRLTVFPAEK